VIPDLQIKSLLFTRTISILTCRFALVADRRWISITLIGVLAFAASAGIGMLMGIPEPRIHDEFSYLLAADTFASGRLSNPPHPMWIHFESFHIIQQPTYMSKYPPGQGLALATGQLLGGHPIVGVWLSFGIMCAAITWMLYGWTSARWALFGGAIAIIHPSLGMAGYWAQSYWGGAVAATGGSLVAGGMRRLMRRPRIADAVITAMGLGILANSRPYEGLLITLPAGVLLLRWIVSKDRLSWCGSVRNILLPIAIVLLPTVIAMGYYNYRVAGDAFRLPYQIHEQTYAGTPLFIWQPPPPEPVYRHKLLRELHMSYGLSIYQEHRSLLGLIWKIAKSLYILFFEAVNILAIPLIGTFTVLTTWAWRNCWARRALLILAVFIAGLTVQTFAWLHYVAPIIGLNYFFVVTSFRLWLWQNRKVGMMMLWIVPLLSCLALSKTASDTMRLKSSSPWPAQRADLVRQLEATNDSHVILVRYGPKHFVTDEWVYNEAGIDAAKVVFARHMDQTQDCRLLNYFRSRRMWLLDVDMGESLPELRPYPINLCN
jgi:hypothetical protein